MLLISISSPNSKSRSQLNILAQISINSQSQLQSMLNPQSQLHILAQISISAPNSSQISISNPINAQIPKSQHHNFIIMISKCDLTKNERALKENERV